MMGVERPACQSWSIASCFIRNEEIERVPSSNFLKMFKKICLYSAIIFLALGIIYLSVSFIIQMSADKNTASRAGKQ